jgi:hypothetical protein
MRNKDDPMKAKQKWQVVEERKNDNTKRKFVIFLKIL